MSEVAFIATITNRAGTGAVDFSNGVNISGSDSGLAAFNHKEGSSEPSSPTNGDTWWDTANEVYKIYLNDEWTEVTINSSGIAWGGDRGVRTGGRLSSYQTTIDYFDITTTGNAVDFGDLTADMANHSPPILDLAIRALVWGSIVWGS